MKDSVFMLCAFASILLINGCSLSSDVMKMDDSEDFEAYALKWAPSEDAFVAVQRVAKPAIDARQWEKAAAVFERFQPKFPSMQKRFSEIIGILKARESQLEVTNLGSGVNTGFNEIKPSLTPDGKRLYFASDRPGGKGELDIYLSQFEDGKWSPAMNLGDRINTSEHETINSISFDGTSILLYGGFPGHMGNGDNFFFEKAEKGWSTIKHFPPMVNSKAWDSDAFFTPDGKAVLITSDREGVQGKRVSKGTPFHGSEAGNSDIWISFRRGNTWSPPINLGPMINTPYCERSPFLHPDGKTLYFSSDGHPGLGKLDVFKSVRLNERTWTEWSEPVNLGKEINTSDDDWAYKITTDGKFAAFSASDRPGGFGMNDIYITSLPVAAQPESKAVTITGTVLDENGNPIGANIMVQDLETGDIIGELRSDPQTGKILFTVPTGKNFGIYLEREGYYPDAKNLDLRGYNPTGEGDDNFAFNFNMKSLEALKTMRDKYGELLSQRVNNIFFDFNKYELKKESFFELERLYRFLEQNPDIRVKIEAHTDDIGSDAFNLDLSMKRARAVVDYLISKGLTTERLVPVGHGESRPEVPNDTEENRALNRRVEFRIAE